jgi:hypothetical protein
MATVTATAAGQAAGELGLDSGSLLGRQVWAMSMYGTSSETLHATGPPRKPNHMAA